MHSILKAAAISAVVAVTGAVSASAATIDFTSNSTGTATADWSLQGYEFDGTNIDTIAINTGTSTTATCAADSGFTLACENDGYGIGGGDEFSNPLSSKLTWITITFTKAVQITGYSVLDAFADASNPDFFEKVYLTKGAVAPGAIEATVVGSELNVPNVPETGFASTSDISVKGTVFTFWVAEGAGSHPNNDFVGSADAALASIEVAAVPLPAGVVLLGSALAGLGLARRRKS